MKNSKMIQYVKSMINKIMKKLYKVNKYKKQKNYLKIQMIIQNKNKMR